MPRDDEECSNAMHSDEHEQKERGRIVFGV